VALGILSLIVAQLRRRALDTFGQTSTVSRLLPEGLVRRRRWITRCRVAGVACWVLALAGPLIGSRLMEFKQHGLDVFIAVDCSLSMQAQDLPPSRMANAKLVLGQLIDRLQGSRIGLIAFAGQAYVECPLTIDQGAVRETLDSSDVGTVPIPGTVIGDAIRVAVKGLKAGEGGHRVLILLTDGEDHHSDPVAAAKEAAHVGMKIFAIGIGSPQGEPIPIFDDQGHRTGYKTDKKGEVVMSRVDESMLTQITRETGGQYFRATSTGDEVDPLVHALENLEQGDQKTRIFNRYENRFQWPLAAGLLLLLLSMAIPERGWRKT
jgi:Ca-activated chloride channel family protein